MSDNHVATVRIRRPARVTTDGGRNVWSETIETVELELVSTAQLEAILQSEDEVAQGAIRKVLSGKREGVLARDPASGAFEIIGEDDLETLLGENENLPIRRPQTGASAEPAGRDDEPAELSLVSTQMLRQMIPTQDGTASKPAPPVKPKAVKDRSGGFDPYNSA